MSGRGGETVSEAAVSAGSGLRRVMRAATEARHHCGDIQVAVQMVKSPIVLVLVSSFGGAEEALDHGIVGGPVHAGDALHRLDQESVGGPRMEVECPSGRTSLKIRVRTVEAISCCCADDSPRSASSPLRLASMPLTRE